MITGITTNSGGRYIATSVNQNSPPYPTGNHVNDGDVRFSTMNGTAGFDVCCSGNWVKWMGNTATVSLTPQAVSILDWAEKKMIEEQRIEELARSNPTVADAAEALRAAEEQLRVVVALVK